MRQNCAPDRLKILCLYDSGFQRKVFKRVKNLSETIKENERTKEERRDRPWSLLQNSLTNHRMHSLAS